MCMDDLCFGGTSNFQISVVKRIIEKLSIGTKERDVFKYIKIDIKDGERNRIIMEQNYYIREKVRIHLVV